jgi:hypothetical protein
MHYAKGMMRPKGTKGMQRRGAISGLRNKDISLEGFLATEYLYLPEFLDEEGNPYPLFKDAPIAAYYILRLKSAAMDFFDFYQGTTFPDYRQPKYPHLLKYNTRLSGDRGRGFREMQEFESASGNVYRKATNVKGYGGANALVIMDAKIGLQEDDPDIKEEINDLGDAGFNQEFLWQVIQSLESQYAIYYDIVEGIIKEKGLKSIDIPMFKPVYPVFTVNEASYDALDPILHIDTLTKSTILIFKFTLGSQSFADFTLSRNSQLSQTHIRWIWTDAQAQQMKYIIDRAKEILPKIEKTENGITEFVPVAVDLAMRSDSPTMERAIARQVARPTTFSADWRQNMYEDNWSAWTYNYVKTENAPYNVPVEDRASALVRLNENAITERLKILCAFFGLMKTNSSLKTALFGARPLREDKNNKTRTAIVTTLSAKNSSKAEDFVKNIRKLVEAKIGGNQSELTLDQIQRASTIDISNSFENQLNKVSDQKEAAQIINDSIDIANKWLIVQASNEFTDQLDKFSNQNQKVVQDTLTLLGFDFFRFLDILGYTDRYYGFRLSIWDEQDDYALMCKAVHDQLNKRSLLEERVKAREYQEKYEENVSNIIRDLTIKMLETLRSIIGFESFTKGLQDFVLSTIYYNNEMALEQSTMAGICNNLGLPLNVSYLPFDPKLRTTPWADGAMRFSLHDDERYKAKKYLDMYKTNKIVFTNCTIDVVIKEIQKKDSTILSVARACLGKEPQVDPQVQASLKSALENAVTQFADDIKFVSTIYMYLQAFADITRDYCPIPKAWLNKSNFFGVDLSLIKPDEYANSLKYEILDRFRDLTAAFTKPLQAVFGGDVDSIRSKVDKKIQDRVESMNTEEYKFAARCVNNFNLVNNDLGQKISVTIDQMHAWFPTKQHNRTNGKLFELLRTPSQNSPYYEDLRLIWDARERVIPFITANFDSTRFRNFVEQNTVDTDAVHFVIPQSSESVEKLFRDVLTEALETLTELYANAKNIAEDQVKTIFTNTIKNSPYGNAKKETLLVVGAVEIYVKDVALDIYIQKQREEFNKALPTYNLYVQVKRFEAELERQKSYYLEYFSARDQIDLSIFLQPFAPTSWAKLRTNLINGKMFSEVENYLNKCQKEIDTLAMLLREPTIQTDKITRANEWIERQGLQKGVKIS